MAAASSSATWKRRRSSSRARARSSPPRPAELVDDGADLVPGGTQRPEVDVAERSSASRWAAACSKRLVGVLAVEVDQLGAHRCQLAGRRQPPVDVGPAAPDRGMARASTTSSPGVAAGVAAVGTAARAPCATGPDESALDPGLVGAGPHQHRVGPSADQQLDGVDDQGLAGPGLAGERRHARAEHEAQVGDHPEVADGQFEHHPVT